MDFEKLSQQYRGDTARDYNLQREGGRKWNREQAALAGLLAKVPEGISTLDVPVGTGRMFEFYRKHALRPTGVDVSPDMLEEARENARKIGLEIELQTGDIRHLPFNDASFELVVCVRFLNWVDAQGLRASVAELARVSAGRLLIGIRHVTPLADLRPVPRDLLRFVRQSLGHARKRARDSGLVYHQKKEVQDLFADLNLRIDSEAVVEKRSDGTDYSLYLLRKA